MSNIKLLRNGRGQRNAPLTSTAGGTVRPPKLGPDWWTLAWRDSTGPVDRTCQEQVRVLTEAWENAGRYEGDPGGELFAEIRLDAVLPLELWQAILAIPDEFADPHGLVLLRKVDDDGAPAVRVCSPDGRIIGSVNPAELLRIDVWLELSAHWLLASCGIYPDAVRSLMEREMPRS